eukprot:13895488-Ditylum_brightwellii.AAC.1
MSTFSAKHRENNKPNNCSFKAQTSSTLNIVQLQEDDNDDACFIQGIRQRLELVETKNIQAWFEENPSWNAPLDKP